jgi:CDP-glycerol glycerophosphotransferase (TagB/SpsB family)
MTGLPRFDRLRELGAQVPVPERGRILLCPTWRYWLAPLPSGGTQRRVVSDDFFESDFAQQWLGLLNDARLRELAEAHGMRIGFLPHPNLQAALETLQLPEHVEALTFEGNDVQQLIAESALMITDYSSMSFNAAYIDRAVVYFQFDAERLSAGAHVGRPGYFHYERDGFGPVTPTIGQTVDAVHTIVVGHDRRPAPLYQQRIDTTFTERDGRCCERTTAAIEALSPVVAQRRLT